MTQYDNTNRGAAWPNDRKESDRHPDFKGTLNVEGVEYWLSAWVKQSQKDGSDFFSFQVQAKQQRDQPRQTPAPRTIQRPQAQQQSQGDGFEDSSIPF